jgi:hypothetical protein
MVDGDAAAFLASLVGQVEQELTQRCVDEPPAGRAALLAEYRRRAEDYQTLSLMRRLPARLSGSASAMSAATGLSDDEIAYRLLRALASAHRRVAAAVAATPRVAASRQSGQ